MEISYVLFVLSSANFILYVCYYFCTVFYCQINKRGIALYWTSLHLYVG